MFKLLTLAFFLFGLLSHVASQSIERSVIATAGETLHAGSWQLSTTLGEPISETYESPTRVLTQGFQQIQLVGNPVGSGTAPIEIKIYPVPAATQLHIEQSGNVYARSFEVLTVCGQLVQSGSLQNSTTLIPLQELASGHYLLRIQYNNRSSHHQFIKL